MISPLPFSLKTLHHCSTVMLPFDNIIQLIPTLPLDRRAIFEIPQHASCVLIVLISTLFSEDLFFLNLLGVIDVRTDSIV